MLRAPKTKAKSKTKRSRRPSAKENNKTNGDSSEEEGDKKVERTSSGTNLGKKKKARSSRRRSTERENTEGATVTREDGEEKEEEDKTVGCWLNAVFDKGPEGVVQEFKIIKRMMLVPEECSANLASKKKCRYPDVFCLDVTRVQLKTKDPKDNFIHANYVDSARKEKRFICAQGPLENTSEDFWMMINDQMVEVIVMLCREVENGEPKCFGYFPKIPGETLTFGDYQITLDEIQQMPVEGAVIQRRRLLLQTPTSSRARKIHHIQWEDWPDKGVPECTEPVEKLLRLTRSTKRQIVVHCSAGIGRTGTIVFIEVLLETLCMKDKPKDPIAILEKIRNERSSMVQTPMQYLFAHMVALEYFKRKNKFSSSQMIKFFEFKMEYERLYMVLQEQPTQKMEVTTEAQETDL